MREYYLQRKVNVQCVDCGDDVQVLVGHAAQHDMIWCDICRPARKREREREWYARGGGRQRRLERYRRKSQDAVWMERERERKRAY
jgi:hypothetical protein